MANLYTLKPGDIFITKHSESISSYAIVDSVVKESSRNKYKVQVEFLAHHDSDKLAPYHFDSSERVHDPIKWFAPQSRIEVRSGREKDYKNIIKMLFEYELNTEYWQA